MSIFFQIAPDMHRTLAIYSRRVAEHAVLAAGSAMADVPDADEALDYLFEVLKDARGADEIMVAGALAVSQAGANPPAHWRRLASSGLPQCYVRSLHVATAPRTGFDLSRAG